MLAVERAGWHTSEEVALPEGLHLLLKLPSHSPELMPDERPWAVGGRTRVANWRMEDLDELEGVLAERCRGILASPEAVRSRTRFRRWREAAC